MALTELPRLSPFNIEDPLVRAELYRAIRKGDESWGSYMVQPDEVLRPELAAYRYYGTDQMKWVVLIAAGMDDMREKLESGVVLRLPPASWVREKIRELSE